MLLTSTQAARLRQYGFVRLPGAVPRPVVVRALKAINHSVGEGIDPSQIVKFRAQTYTPELVNSDAILDTFRLSGMPQLLDHLIGEGQYNPVASAQIALRFPHAGDEPYEVGPHLDGTHTPTNGVPEGTFHSFTALCHVMLSDVPCPNWGNLTVWPGTHYRYARHFAKNGIDTSQPHVHLLRLPRPVQVTGRAGDIVIAHHLLGHSAGCHIGPNIRYGLFFRIRHIHHYDHQLQAVTDPWLEWPGLASG